MNNSLSAFWFLRARRATRQFFQSGETWWVPLGTATSDVLICRQEQRPWPSIHHYQLWQQIHWGFSYYTAIKNPKIAQLLADPIFCGALLEIRYPFYPAPHGHWTGWSDWLDPYLNPNYQHLSWTTQWQWRDQAFYDPDHPHIHLSAPLPGFKELAPSLHIGETVNIGQWTTDQIRQQNHQNPEWDSNLNAPLSVLIGGSLAILQAAGAGHFDYEALL